MHIRKTYMGSDTRRLIPEKVEFAGVSGDNETATLIFEFPETYADYDKYIEWNIEIPFPDSKKTFKPLYRLTDDSFVIPRRLTKVCNGLDVDFNLVFVKDNTLIEKSLQSTVHFATSANGDATDDETDEILSLYIIANAHKKAEYSENDVSYRPQITFTALDGSTQTLTLNMPYLNDAGKIPDYFLDKVFVVEIFSIASVNDLISLTEARKSDWAITPEQDLYLLTGEDYSISSNWLKVYSHDPTYNSITISNKSTTGSLEVLGNTRLIGDLEVDGNVVLNDDARVKGDLVVEGSINTVIDVHASNDLSSGRDTSVGGDLSVDGNARIKGDLDVDGSIDTVINVNAQTDLTAGQDLKAGRNLEIERESLLKGDVTAKSDVLIEGDLDVDSNLNVSQDVSVTGSVTTGTLEALQDVLIGGNAEVGGDLLVNGSINTVIDVHASNDLSSARDTTVGRDLRVDGNASVGGDLLVEGSINTVINVNAQNDLTSVRDVKSGRNLEVEGTTLLKGDVTALSGVNITGDVLIGGNTEIKGDLDVDGSIDTVIDVHASNDLSSERDVSVGRDLQVEGNARVKGDLDVDGSIDTVINVNAQTDLTAGQDLKATRNLEIGGTSILKGDVLIESDLQVDGDINTLLGGNSPVVTDANGKLTVANISVSDLENLTGIEGNVQLQIDTKEDKINKVNSWAGTPSDVSYPSEKLVKSSLDTKVDKNTAITPDTKCKVTYDAKGLVTGGADLADTDVPPLSTSKIIGLDTTLSEINTTLGTKVDKNDTIVGATKAKITYDSKGLVTAGADLVASDIPNLNASKINAGTLGVDRIPNISANKITSDTLADARIPSNIERNTNKIQDIQSTIGYAGSDTDYPSVHAVQKYTSGVSTPILEAISDLQDDKADDDKVVHKAGNETITGIKSFENNVNIGTTSAPKNLVLKGDLTIEGDIVQNGSSYETHAEKVFTANDKITLRDGAVSGLVPGTTAGFLAKLYDGYTDGEMALDSSGTIRVGDVGDTQPVLTRKESEDLSDAGLLAWDSTNVRAYTRVLSATDIPNLSATKITTDTLADARIPTSVERIANKRTTWQTSPTDTAYPSEKLVKTALDAKVDFNPVISGATKTKITYDAKGLVTAGADLVASDIPALATSKITGLDTALSGLSTDISNINTSLGGKVDSNSAITSATKCKITYDSKGLVTSGADLTATDIPNLATSKITSGTFADARIPALEISKITGLQTAIDSKITANTAITGATKCKITYDTKGLVTAGADLIASDIPALDTAKITTGTFVDARIPSLNASKITAGTFADARIPTTVERIVNKVTAWQTTPTDTAYPTEKLVKDSLDAKATASDLSSHTSNTSNPHSVTKAQVGLSNVDNTSDINKPISTATQTALDGKQDTLTFDSTPVAGSDNPVKSGGIYSALNTLADDLKSVELSSPIIINPFNLEDGILGGEKFTISYGTGATSELNIGSIDPFGQGYSTPMTLMWTDNDASSFAGSIKWSITPAIGYQNSPSDYNYGEILSIERGYDIFRDMLDENGTTIPTGLWVGARGAFVRMTSDRTSLTPGYYELIHRGYLDKRLEDITTGKQDKLTFDSAPTASSTNPVTSGGVFTALQQNATLKYSTTFSGTGSATSFPITHSLNDAYPIVTVWKTSGGVTKVVDVEIQSTSVNQITLVFAVAPATTDSFNVRVMS